MTHTTILQRAERYTGEVYCPYWFLLVVRPVAGLVWVAWPRQLALWRGSLHPLRWGAPGWGPHARTDTPLLGKRRAKRPPLVFGELGVVVVRWWWARDRGSSVLGWWMTWSWWWVTHVGGHLPHHVPRRRCDGRGLVGERRGWRLVVHAHVRVGVALRRRVLHRHVDGRRAVVGLWRWRHHVVRMAHYRLVAVVPRVVHTRAWLVRPGGPLLLLWWRSRTRYRSRAQSR